MNYLLRTSLFCLFTLFLFIKTSWACHPLPLTYFNYATYTPGVGFSATGDSNPATFGCNFYWLEMEVRCDSSKMDDSNFSGVYSAANCIPFYQGQQVTKPVQMAMTYPAITVPDSVLCPGMTYYYRLRENIDTLVGPWTPVMSFTVPGTLDTSVGSLNLTASPQVFCGSTQLGWNFTPGGGCQTISCDTTTRYQWYVISGEPMNVPVNFSCDTCPYPFASPSIPTTYGLTITKGDTNSCGYGIYTMNPITVTPLPPPIPGTVSYVADCNGNIDLNLSGYYGDIQWYSISSGQLDSITGAIYDTLSLSGISSGDCFTVQLTTSCGSIFSDTVCLGTITPSVPGTLSYSDDCQGNVSLFLSGNLGDIQWQISTNGTVWNDLIGDTSGTLLQQGFISGNCYRAMSYTNCDTSYSDTICPVVQPQPTNGIVNYSADCNGNLSMDIIGYFGDLQWQSSITSGVWSDVSGASLDSLMFSGASPGECFRVRISTLCDTLYSDTVCVGQMVPSSSGATSYTDDCQGNVSLFLTGNQGNVQWQVSTNGTVWNDLVGDTSSTLLQPSFVAGNCYRAMSYTNCDTSYSDTICPVIQPQPVNGVINYSADCSGNVCLWVSSTQGDLQWQSSIAGGSWTNIINANSDSVCQSGINTGDCFRVMIFTACDTIYTDTICPTMFEGPTAAFTYSPPGNSQSNVPMSFTDMSTGNIVSWEWDFGGGNPGQNNHIPNPTHTYHSSGFYTVTLIVTDANGCTDTVSVVIEIENPACEGAQCVVIIPNVFTPNKDGDNDVLMFKNLEHYTNNLQVFNRWGKLVFEQENYKNDWDGDDHAEGTYYFILTINNLEGRAETYKGAVTLLR